MVCSTLLFALLLRRFAFCCRVGVGYVGLVPVWGGLAANSLQEAGFGGVFVWCCPGVAGVRVCQIGWAGRVCLLVGCRPMVSGPRCGPGLWGRFVTPEVCCELHWECCAVLLPVG